MRSEDAGPNYLETCVQLVARRASNCSGHVLLITTTLQLSVPKPKVKLPRKFAHFHCLLGVCLQCPVSVSVHPTPYTPHPTHTAHCQPGHNQEVLLLLLLPLLGTKIRLRPDNLHC